jgi:hypothetical protein
MDRQYRGLGGAGEDHLKVEGRAVLAGGGGPDLRLSGGT